ncbi:MAG: Serine/threonine-protein kinase PknL, partial [Planctomycetota bacterium]
MFFAVARRLGQSRPKGRAGGQRNPVAEFLDDSTHDDSIHNESIMVKVRDFLGPYRLARLIRLGSTCQVWEAILEQDNKRYALKVLRPEQRGNKEEIG